jgi:DNA polymerase III epsilon subunit-like protein
MLKIATIDFEATALSPDADAIEVGVAIFDRQSLIHTWSSLVRPSANCLWNEASANVHKIAKLDLDRAPEPRWVAAELNRLMAGVPIAYCDGYQFDQRWMASLFRAADVEPGFTIEPVEEMPRLHLRVVRHHMLAYLGRTLAPHRAGDDALRLMQAYVYALGKKVNVVALS